MPPHDEVALLSSLFPGIPIETIDAIFDSFNQDYDEAHKALVDMSSFFTEESLPTRSEHNHGAVRHVRFVTTATRNRREDCVQLSCISLFANRRILPIRRATNPGGRNPRGEGPNNVTDGNVRSKWLDFHKSPLVLELAVIDPVVLDAYVLNTANDFPNRDPVRWRLEGSSDGGRTWRILDDRSAVDQNIPLRRHTESGIMVVKKRSQPGFGRTDREWIAAWTDANTRRPREFADAAAAVCIVPQLMSRSRMDNKIELLESVMRQRPLQGEDFATTASNLVHRAFALGHQSDPRTYCGSDPGGLASGCFYNGCNSVYNSLETWQRPLLHVALREILRDNHDKDYLKVLCGLLLRASLECAARRHEVFFLVVDRVAEVTSPAESVPDSNHNLEHHREVLKAAAQAEIDDLKDKAFKSTFIEPTKMYFRAGRDQVMEGDVEVHGSNTYLALLLASLGVKLARSPLLHDEVKGIAAYRDALKPEDIRMLQDPTNVGKSWEAVVGRCNFPTARYIAPNAMFFHGSIVLEFALDCLKDSRGESRRELRPYLDAFVHYFSEEIVVERLCNAFLATESVEASMDIVYNATVTAKERKECTKVRYWLWDEMTGEFRRDRGLSLLCSAGICRKTDSNH